MQLHTTPPALLCEQNVLHQQDPAEEELASCSRGWLNLVTKEAGRPVVFVERKASSAIHMLPD